MERESFVFYRSFFEAIAKFRSAEAKAEAYEAIAAYGLYGEEPEGLSFEADLIFGMAKPQLDANNKRSVDGSKGGRPKKPMVSDKKTSGFKEENHWLSKEKPNVNVNANVNANANENVKGGIVKGGRFQRPTPAEVRAYCEERKNRIDPDAFISYYESNGWKVGKNPMKDWKAAVRNWERMDKERGNPPQRSGTTNKFNAYSNKQSYDFVALEASFESDVGELSLIHI